MKLKYIFLVFSFSLFASNAVAGEWIKSSYTTTRIAATGTLMSTVIKDKPGDGYVTISIWKSNRVVLRCFDYFNKHDVETASVCQQLR